MMNSDLTDDDNTDTLVLEKPATNTDNRDSDNKTENSEAGPQPSPQPVEACEPLIPEPSADSTSPPAGAGVLNLSQLHTPKGPGKKHRWAEAERALSETDLRIAELIEKVGPCTLEPDRRDPYEALVRSIAFQQLHTRAAQQILARFHAIYGDYFPPPLMLMVTPEELLRSVGFSKSKIAAIQGIATAAHDGRLPALSTCRKLSNEELISRLTALRGVGRWTAEMFLIFTLGRKDVLPVDDFGIREGYRLLHEMEAQPTPSELAAKGEAYAPWRTVASWYLWRGLEILKQEKTGR